MYIRLNIGMRCGRRQNDAAYQRHRRRCVTGRHAIIIHRRHMEYQRSRGHVPNALDCKAAAESSSDRASFPVKRVQCAQVKGFTCSGMCCAPPEPKEFRRLCPRRATPFPPNLAFPNPNLGSRLLLEQSQPVVRRFVLQAVHSKTRLDTTTRE